MPASLVNANQDPQTESVVTAAGQVGRRDEAGVSSVRLSFTCWGSAVMSLPTSFNFPRDFFPRLFRQKLSGVGSRHRPPPSCSGSIPRHWCSSSKRLRDEVSALDRAREMQASVTAPAQLGGRHSVMHSLFPGVVGGRTSAVLLAKPGCSPASFRALSPVFSLQGCAELVPGPLDFTRALESTGDCIGWCSLGSRWQKTLCHADGVAPTCAF